jgi:hypothetical protein
MKKQSKNAYLLKAKRLIGIFGKVTLLLLGVILLSTQLSAEDWMQLYPEEIDRPVYDMEFSELPGISEYGLIFAFPGNGGGLGYFDDNGQFNIYSVATNLGAVSVTPDNTNNRIFCAFGCGTYSDGLYEFDVPTHQFELIEWAFNPNFVEKLPSGYYFGFGWDWFGGLFHSVNGDNWANIDYFNNKVVRDVAETSDSTLFVAAGNEIYIGNDTTFSSYDAGLPVNDIYVRHYPTEEVFIACGDGTDSDGLYRVEYEDGEITGITLINWLLYPNKIYEYENWLVVGCLNSEGLWLVEPAEMGEMHQIGAGLDFQDVYCSETYPMYCHNIMVGTDNGVYLGTNLEYPGNISVFEAYWNNSDDMAIIHWRTEYEIDILGWNIYRNDENDFATAVKINIDLIPGHGTSSEPHDYYYTDVEANPMYEYWYWLESVDLGGMTYIYGPTNLLIPNCDISVFTAQYLDNIPTLFWVTESETDNLGWYVYRNDENNFDTAEKISDLIEGYGTTSEPHSYIYQDLDLQPTHGDEYWYWLESIDLGGVSYIYYPPANLVIPVAVDESHSHPADIVLYQNYPNPFSGSTTISFSFCHRGTENTEIEIYNVKGQLVRKLGFRSPDPILSVRQLTDRSCGSDFGFGKAKWDGKDENGKQLSNGIYLYRLETDDYKSEIKKMILIK